MIRNGAALLVVVLLATTGCKSSSAASASGAADGADAGACTSPSFDGSPLGVSCNALVDARGRTVLLHGVNARARGVFDDTFSDGRAPLETVPELGDADAARIRDIGFDALRLPVDWSGLEPDDGAFDEAYLDRVAAVVASCARAGLYVLLDMHQDAYSKEIGQDGAPRWAIVPPPTELLGGPLGDTLQSRLLSKQVQDAFNTFFGDSADGARLRERFGRAAVHLLARFAEDPAVVGLELFNEPPATDEHLYAFYTGLVPGLRAVAPRKLLFFEPPATRNVLDRANLGDGTPIAPGTVYAPHVYTLVFNSSDATRASFTKDTLRLSNDNAREEADSFVAPLAITEWGYGPADPAFGRYVRYQQELQDEERASSFLWLWKEVEGGRWGLYDMNADGTTGAERASVVDALARVRLEASPGRLLRVGWDADAARFEVRFVVDATPPLAETVVSLGATTAFAGRDARATCDGSDATARALDGGGRRLAIPCGAAAGVHTVALTPR